MNLDERLEALTRLVELLASMFRDGEARHSAQMAKLDASIERFDANIVKLSEMNTKLGIIVMAHE